MVVPLNDLWYKMSKKKQAVKEKERAERLGISLHQYQKLRGRSRSQRRQKEALGEDTTVAEIRRRTEFVWDEANKRSRILDGAFFPENETYLKAIGGMKEWNQRLFGRLWGARFDNRNDYRTSIGNVLFQDKFVDLEWSKLSIAHPILGEFEANFSEKIRSRSVYIAEDFRNILINWVDVKPVTPSELITKAFSLVGSSIGYSDRWSIDDLHDVILSLDRDKGSGYPWMAKKCEVLTSFDRKELGIDSIADKWSEFPSMVSRFEENRSKVLSDLPSALIRVKERIDQLNDNIIPQVINVTGLRTESSKYTEESNRPWKQRLVWNVPYDHAIMEKLLCGKLQMLIRADKTGFSDHYWGSLEKENLGERKVLSLIDLAGSWDADCISIDFSAFDQHITETIMSEFTRIMHKHAILNEAEYKYLRYGLLNSELWTGWGVLQRNNGIPSGSFFTNLGDSVINAAFCEAVGIYYSTDVDYVVNGDDCCLVARKSLTNDDLVKVASHFGMDMNREKQWRHSSAFSFNKEIFSHELNGSTPMIHRVLNSLMRHDQRKRILGELDDLGAAFSQLRRLKNHPFKEAFLLWLVERLENPDSRIKSWLNPLDYIGDNFPAIERFNAPDREKMERPVLSYSQDWFWETLCSS